MKNQDKFTADEKEWKDWRWQQRNSLHSGRDISRFYPNFPESEIGEIARYEQERRWGITPYTLSLMELDEQGNPSPSDPLVKQTFPIRGFAIDTSVDSYVDNVSTNKNWELPGDMKTPILQHKYTQKVLFRIPNACLAYCGFCFEVERVEDKRAKKQGVNENLWRQSIDYIKGHPEVMEVILSGGEPLLLDNETLEEKLSDIRSIPHIKAIRVHTRALTFNPYRIDEDLVEIFKKYRVNEMGIHMCHPNELTPEVKEALGKFDEQGYGGILKMGQTPLLKGINDNKEVLQELFIRMYTEFGIKPYYLLHSIPWSPGANQYRTDVKTGVRIINAMKGHIPNIAIPEYIIVHHTGKKTVPLEPGGTPEFQYTQNENGHPIVRFRNWKGNWETYLDRKTITPATFK